jgi:hypothetical protein
MTVAPDLSDGTSGLEFLSLGECDVGGAVTDMLNFDLLRSLSSNMCKLKYRSNEIVRAIFTP